MILRQFITVLFISILVTFGYYLIARKKEPLTKFIYAGLIIFAGSWAGGLWLKAVWPMIFRVNSISYLIVALVLGLVFTLISMRRPPSGRYETLEKLEYMQKEKELQKLTYTVLNVLICFLFFIFIAAVITRYFFE